MKYSPIKSFHLRNFKAVRNSRTISLTPLTVFIGNNGSGKSSIVEGLETYQKIVIDGLDEALHDWRGFEYIRNLAVNHRLKKTSNDLDRPTETNPIKFNLKWEQYQTTMSVSTAPNGDAVFIEEESFKIGQKIIASRTARGDIYYHQESPSQHIAQYSDGVSLISSPLLMDEIKTDILNNISRWQFINLNPYLMGVPQPRKRSAKQIQLHKDGSNIAEYMLSLYHINQSVFNGIVETLQYILPYARDLQTPLTSELERNVYLQLTESNFKIPGWLLSTGTLRILALLAILRHPEPAPLIVIEEIENGLDPRTIHLIVDEIRNLVETGKTQVIITTHSPYLLDLLTLSQIILVERDSENQPVFSRPGDEESLQEWSKKFGPGKLYTMNRLGKKE